MTLKDICLRRQACRNYLPVAVEQEKLDYILECARLAPSACNKQPWSIYVLESKEAIDKACSCYSRDWAKTAPLFVLCCIRHDEEWVRSSDGRQHGIVDVSILAEHICLAATEQGLDTCWICNFDIQKATELFGLPANEEAAILIPIGYSEEPVREKSRKKLNEIMKTYSISIITALSVLTMSVSSCGILGGTQWDSEYLAGAASNALTAATLSNSQVVELSRQSVEYMDKENKVNTGSYKTRLDKLMAGITEVGGVTLNLKVYETKEINAFACGDGSIRVYSGLMDVMDDDQLIAIIGHEIGHVMHKDTKTAMQRAYATAAARGVVAAAGGTLGTLAASSIGDIAQSYVSAQFSQKQEFAADDYGFDFAVKHGHSPYSMATALEKLVELNGNGGTTASYVSKMFSSHPDSALRAQKMRAKADAYKK